ncbi:chromate transporter [Butyrivibrio sp. NC3005]|uniref:chromate transporter n=1 Tax=Butyrivibrio sp. NC3005 TaxID=1280685 RepID=UPI00047CC9BC|nr:chromate transporter [Butyrivibrio sp. NC3005]
MIFIELFITFAKIGLFTFGGGYAMISLIEDICVEKKKWISSEEMMNITVMAESTPGPVAINCATYVGYKKRGISGAIFATIGIILPSFIVIYLISLCLDDFLSITYIANAFKGIKLAVGILILDAAIKLIGKMSRGFFQTAVMIFSCAVMMIADICTVKISSMLLMLAVTLFSLLIFCVKNVIERKGKK